MNCYFTLKYVEAKYDKWITSQLSMCSYKKDTRLIISEIYNITYNDKALRVSSGIDLYTSIQGFQLFLSQKKSPLLRLLFLMLEYS